MRGEKLVIIFLLLGLALGQWITEQPKKRTPPPLEPTKAQNPISMPSPPAPIEINDVQPQITIEEVLEQQTTTQTSKKQASQEPIKYNESLDMFDHNNRIPDTEIQKRHQRHHQNGHKKKRHHQKVRSEYNNEQNERAEVQDQTSLQNIMDNGIVLLVVLGVVGLAITKICIRQDKNGKRRARRLAYPNQQTISLQIPRTSNNQNEAIDEVIRYHETQILMLRNNNLHAPTYMPYQ